MTPVAELGAELLCRVRLAPGLGGLEFGLAFLSSTIGHGYGYLTIGADAVNALTGLELSFGVGNRMVCSTQTMRYLERRGAIPDRQPGAVTPAHIAWYASAHVPNALRRTPASAVHVTPARAG